ARAVAASPRAVRAAAARLPRAPGRALVGQGARLDHHGDHPRAHDRFAPGAVAGHRRHGGAHAVGRGLRGALPEPAAGEPGSRRRAAGGLAPARSGRLNTRVPFESEARLLLVLHAVVGAATVAVATHLVVWMRGWLKGRFARRRAVVRFAWLSLALFAATFLLGNLGYPLYKVKVRSAYLENPMA